MLVKERINLAGIGTDMGKFSGVDAQLIGGATLSLAVSAELKYRIDDAAKFENVSVDTWALRVMKEALNAHPNADQHEWVVSSLRRKRRGRK